MLFTHHIILSFNFSHNVNIFPVYHTDSPTHTTILTLFIFISLFIYSFIIVIYYCSLVSIHISICTNPQAKQLMSLFNSKANARKYKHFIRPADIIHNNNNEWTTISTIYMPLTQLFFLRCDDIQMEINPFFIHLLFPQCLLFWYEEC